ncbi:hypothetical protein [Arthrobacter sp. NPDC056727]|uniref:hypothetical protein n=1 Tax=Arthrobacter sp. NPDC056727 TaxID=3345927 RepID=UPI00367339A3
MKTINPSGFKVNPKVLALLANPSLQFTFVMRIARGGGLIGKFARSVLLSSFSSDVTPGPLFSHGIYAPHPIGIVIGQGAVFEGVISIYQGVTIGSDKRGAYPTLGPGCKLFPHCIVVGGIIVGAGCTIGAGVFVDRCVESGGVVRRANY